MPHPFERIPETLSNLQFPGGDITDQQELAGMQLYEQLTSGDEDAQFAQLQRLRYWEMSQWRSRPDQDIIHGCIQSLAKKWGKTYLGDIDFGPEEDVPGAGNRIVTLGAFGMLAFARKSRIISLNFAPFLAEDLDEMAAFDQGQIRLLANNSWTHMHASHPRLYETIAPVTRHISTVLHIQDRPEDLELLDAATALPYLLAATTRMDGYLSMAIHERSVDRTIEKLSETQ